MREVRNNIIVFHSIGYRPYATILQFIGRFNIKFYTYFSSVITFFYGNKAKILRVHSIKWFNKGLENYDYHYYWSRLKADFFFIN